MIQRQANKENLADKGVAHGFDAFVLEYNAQSRTVSIYGMATVVETILGAIYVDCDSNMFIMESVMENQDHVNEVTQEASPVALTATSLPYKPPPIPAKLTQSSQSF
ncbi:ribonuclease III [Penicillium alfredii]|uniref:Ribonuclease III n=1 Tax=Penicillium alfredii TaxID=1506179 RepID=A0A9W9KGF6_9EURO|nr:ribonuclease III [Penicillium alfredii]KAJ5105629.1 ribonuclease III [Penicillium alfredii]